MRIVRAKQLPEIAVKFLRMSDAPTQSPENSLEGQDWGIDEGIIRNPSHALFGVKVIHTFRLLHASHRGLKGVEVFDEMIRWARAGRFKYILVDKYDRFGRNLREAVTVEDELNEAGVYIVSAKEQFDQRQPAGWLAKTMMQMLADFYSRNLATETRKGMRAKLERGEWPWAAPLGYRHPNRRTERGRAVSILEEDPVTGPRVRWAWQEFATGKYTLDQWMDTWNAQEVIDPIGKRLVRSQWHGLFRNRLYVGKMMTRLFPGEEFEAHEEMPRLVSPGTFDRVQELLDIRSSHKKQHHVNDYPLVKILWSQEGDCGFHGETQPKKKASYYRTKAKVAGRKIYLGQKGVESEFSRLLVRIQIRPEMAEGCRAEMLARLKERVPGQRQLEADKLGKQVQRLEEKARTLIRLHTNGDISYDEFRGERSLNEAAQRELRERLSHVSAGFEKEAHDVTTGLAILSSLEVIWDRCATAERRREFAELLFSRVTVDQYSRTRDWALNNPFQRLFEFAQPGSKLVLDGDPERIRTADLLRDREAC